MSNDLTAFAEQEREEHWVSISDMMAGLMMIFLFISVTYMIHVVAEKNKIKDIALTYNEMQMRLYKDLDKEFHDDLIRWNAKLYPDTLSIRFLLREPEVLFESESVEILPRFKAILDSFFPRYIHILMSDDYINDIEEVRIEGHTSSVWKDITDEDIEKYKNMTHKDIAYFKNMVLSQGRTRSVLEYVFSIPQINKVRKVKNWLTKYLTANGLSSSKLIKYPPPDNRENMRLSRRVEFRVRTKAEERIFTIIEKERGKREQSDETS